MKSYVFFILKKKVLKLNRRSFVKRGTTTCGMLDGEIQNDVFELTLFGHAKISPSKPYIKPLSAPFP